MKPRKKVKEKKFGKWKVDSQGNIDYQGDWEYGISHVRLTETDWEEHMHAKDWVNNKDFSDALSYARMNKIHDLERIVRKFIVAYHEYGLSRHEPCNEWVNKMTDYIFDYVNHAYGHLIDPDEIQQAGETHDWTKKDAI
jgi:hypothetical protein